MKDVGVDGPGQDQDQVHGGPGGPQGKAGDVDDPEKREMLLKFCFINVL